VQLVTLSVEMQLPAGTSGRPPRVTPGFTERGIAHARLVARGPGNLASEEVKVRSVTAGKAKECRVPLRPAPE